MGLIPYFNTMYTVTKLASFVNNILWFKYKCRITMYPRRRKGPIRQALVAVVTSDFLFLHFSPTKGYELKMC